MLAALLASLALATPVPTALPPAASQLIHCDRADRLASLDAPRRYTELSAQVEPGTPLTVVLGESRRVVLWSRSTPTADTLASQLPSRGYALDGGGVRATTGVVPTTLVGGVLTSGDLEGAKPVGALNAIDDRPGCWAWDRLTGALTWFDPGQRALEMWMPLAEKLAEAEPDGLGEAIAKAALEGVLVAGAPPGSDAVPRTTRRPTSLVRYNQAEPVAGFDPSSWRPGAVKARFDSATVRWVPHEDPAAGAEALVAAHRSQWGASAVSAPEPGLWEVDRPYGRLYTLRLAGAVATTDDAALARELLAGDGQPWWTEADGAGEPGTVALSFAEDGTVGRTHIASADGITHVRSTLSSTDPMGVMGLERGGFDEPMDVMVPAWMYEPEELVVGGVLGDGVGAASVAGAPEHATSVAGAIESEAPLRFHYSALRLRSLVSPTFPRGTPRRDRREPCRVEVSIDEQGTPYEATAEACPETLRQAAVEAVMASRWYPPRNGAARVKARTELKVTFVER